MRPMIVLCGVVALLGACSRPSSEEAAAPTRATVAGVEMIDYEYPAAGFSCRVPAGWKGREDSVAAPTVVMVGPGTPQRPLSVSISIGRYPAQGSPYRTMDEFARSAYLAADGVKPVAATVNGRKAYRYTVEKPHKAFHTRRSDYTQREETVLIEVPGGWYRLSHAAPAPDHELTRPVFEAVVDSFTPKG